MNWKGGMEETKEGRGWGGWRERSKTQDSRIIEAKEYYSRTREKYYYWKIRS